MRERTTWNRTNIKQAATSRRAEDPRAMNQDHLSQQPAADKYVTGDPSTFAEDVTSPNTWEKEYAGGQTKRNELGMPEMRPETFSHPEKTAKLDEATLLKKADLCTKVARYMLKGRKFANGAAFEAAIEDQSVALMHMPNADLIATADRLAAEEGQEPPAEQTQQAAQEPQVPAQQQQQGGQQQQSATYQQAAQQCMEAMQNGDQEGAQSALATMVQEAVQQQQTAKLAASRRRANDGQEPPPAQQTQQGGMQQQALEQMVQQAVQQAVQQGQAQQAPKMAARRRANDGQEPPAQGQQQQQAGQGQQEPPAAQQQQQQQQAGQGQQEPPAQQMQQAQGQGQEPAPQMQQQADDMLLDEMLMGPDGGMPMAEMDIEMETPSMDVGEVVLAHEDEVLKTLFANDETEQAQQAQDAQQGQKQANVRTASTRTLGTRPTGGVSRVGGAPAGRSGGDVDKLAGLWPSAPDVRDAFNMK